MREFQRYTEGRGGARRQKRRWLWVVPTLFMAVSLVIGIGVRAGAVPVPTESVGYEADVPQEMQQEPQQKAEPTSWVRKILGGPGGVSEGPMNVLVLGVDENPGDGEVAESGGRSDTLMLVRIFPETGEVKLLSVPRDLLVQIEPGVEDKINAAYAYGGVEQATWAIEQYTGVPVDHHAAIDFEGFEKVIDAMGGVEVDVESEDFPDHWRLGDGIETLDGKHALMYARYRGTAGGDLDRIERQQEVVAALRSEAFGWNTATKLPEIAKIMNENVETDLGLTQAVLLGRAMIKQGRDAHMTSVKLEGTPETLSDGAQVLVPDDEANQTKIRQFLY